ncbi:helix-turn-helix transcriptional regulator [Bradyrhizobium sp. BR 10261]|uniref:helix-turn-helix transcriptional regulator n=1 Tax=Bradyrhizobium sp. BR 10261 TaxID=2749992 RepID=UPI001C65324A|nr:helix-turn-helix transcriptional regulator [Bradyrhizobium sp. BR 10261]MBW7965334.1 helix-turn-helix transcriptional regulator [Bradyrhizobium sp. BR 10261]
MRAAPLPSRNRHSSIIAELDELVSALPPSRPLYSKELAQQIGTSVRTLQSASLSARGMSLHSYLRLKRLSEARLQLSTGAFSVKSAALANGFWHLGDFSRVYRSTFGEMPSQTLARARAVNILPFRAPRESKPKVVLVSSLSRQRKPRPLCGSRQRSLMARRIGRRHCQETSG